MKTKDEKAAKARAEAERVQRHQEGIAKIRRYLDADKAWKLIKLQLRYGQRPAGSPQLRSLATKLRADLPRGHFERIPGEPGLRRRGSSDAHHRDRRSHHRDDTQHRTSSDRWSDPSHCPTASPLPTARCRVRRRSGPRGPVPDLWWT